MTVKPSIELTCALLRGERTEWPTTAAEQAALLDVAEEHGVTALVHRALSASERTPPDQGLADRVAERLREEAACELVRVRENERVIMALGAAGIRALVFKGAALAHIHYADSWLRTREDMDLLVAASDRGGACDLLLSLGYAKMPGVEGEYVNHQAGFLRVDQRRIQHNVDLHWKLSNRHRYAPGFAFDELWGRSRALPALGHAARTPEEADALLIACVHLTTHHQGDDRLIWLLDIHRLVSSLTEGDLRSFASRAEDKGMLGPCHVALERTRKRFGTALPSSVSARWFARQRLAEREQRLAAESHQLGIWLSDLAALPGWRERLGLLKEHAFPPADYMLRRFGTRRRTLLPALYFYRALSGTMRLLRRAEGR